MKRFFTVIVSVLLMLSIFTSVSITSFAAEGEREMKFNSNGKFKVMHVTDTHLEDYNVDASVWAIGQGCDREKPDIVIVTGDNVQNADNPEATKEFIRKLMTVFEERNIPVAVTFGNHDSESGMLSREELMAEYNTYSCSVSVDDGEALSGCGTYNIPVLSSDGEKVKFNLWVFDSNDYDGKGHYGCVKQDQVEWYKKTSDELKSANGGEVVYSLAFQHIIVPEVYDVLEKTDKKKLYSFEHIINDGEYYHFSQDGINYGMLNETPCSGYENFGQFDAMVEKGDVLGIFTGHDHTNAFGVQNQGIDIYTSLSSRYNGDRFSTQYGYRILEIDEADTSDYTSKVVHWYDIFTFDEVKKLKEAGDTEGSKIALDIMFKGFFQKLFTKIAVSFSEFFTGRRVAYPEKG